MPCHIYQPTPVVIPDPVSVRRGFRNRRAYQAAQPTRPGDPVNYDSQTVLYDIWIEDSLGQLLAIGPPSINLHRELYPVTVMCNGTPITITKEEYRKCCTWRGCLPTSLKGCTTIEVSIQFRTFECTINLQPRAAPNSIVPLSQVAIQKNNPSGWVRDWCLWHHKICGVNNLYLYDNGSDNFGEMLDMLGDIDREMSITVVRWPYLFGGLHRDCKFAQHGALNHCRMMFGRGSTWILSCDIDEYVIVDNSQTLAQRLCAHEQDGFAVVLLGSYDVPPASSQLPNLERSIRDYTFHDRKFKLQPKYIYRPNAVLQNSCHYAFPRHPIFDKLRFAPMLHDWLLNQTIRRFIKLTPPGAKWRSLKVIREPSGDTHFLHFLGLNTGWKRNTSENEIQFDDATHVQATKLMALIRCAKPFD